MYTSKKWLTACLIVAVFSSFVSCKKEEGPPGPAGKDGNANVKSSIFTVIPYIAGNEWYADMNEAAITQSILNSGAVMVYELVDTDTWEAVPYTTYYSPSFSSSVELEMELYYATVIWSDSDMTLPGNPGQTTFKVVVIAASGLAAHPEVNLNDYNEVQKAFGI